MDLLIPPATDYIVPLPYLPTPSAPAGYDKINFLAEFNRFEFSFPSPRLVASPRLKNLVCPTIYP